jgi:TonB-dependent SusC/RagA subfamily outer membrane receptor
MKKTLFFALYCFATLALAQKPIFVNSKIKSVTIYSNSAEINHAVSANLPAGVSEIVVKNVADYVLENTIQIGAPAHVTVLSAQFTTNYISEYEVDETNPAIKKVRDSITILEKELSKLDNQKTALNKSIELLDKNQNVAGSNSGLNVAELMKLVDYYSLKHRELRNAIQGIEENEAKTSLQIEKLTTKLELNTQKEDSASKGKLVLQVMTDLASTVNFDINYITTNASWQPFYDLRTTNTSTPISLLYKAKVVQNTGIDWKKVKLTLSSGNPTQNNTAPILNAWFLRYGYPKSFGYTNNMSNIMQSLKGEVAGVNIVDKESAPGANSTIRIRGFGSVDGRKSPLYIVNGVPYDGDITAINPNNIKSMDVLKDAAATSVYGSRGADGVVLITTKNMDDYTTIEEQELNISFDIDIPYDILSNGKDHSVTLKDLKIPASYKYYAVPRVDKEAFLLAEISDYSKFNLLPGEANIIFEGMYVGKTTINPNQTADTLNLSMGRDKKIAIKREKVADKSGTKFLSSYKEQTFTYEITVKNNKKEAIEMLLKDQYPISTDKDITVELLDNGKAKENTETGILTWELKLDAGETKKIRISYKVKYPKDKVIENL